MVEDGTRYLLCRPNGGLNDTLVQLELCRRYAARFGRTLIVDTSRCGLRLPFGEVFLPREDFGPPVLGLTAGLAQELDRCASVAPSALAGRISTYVSVWDTELGATVERDSRQRIVFDLECDHAEALLVHEQPGGGKRGFGFLGRVALSPWIADAVTARLLPLGGDYDAIHVRNTDLSTDYLRLFRRCRRLFAGRQLLVCSDAADVKRRAAEVFAASTILSVAEVPDTGGEGLHWSRLSEPRKAAVDLFADLLAIALSRRFVFTAVDARGGRRTGFSGFSVLADMLRQQPDVVRGLLEAADPVRVAALLTAHAAPGGMRAVGRSVAVLDQWRWNHGARWLSLRLGVKLRLRALLPG
ncbi:hypothetical protein [Aquibium microcysteis]|uniref:hypothetical protein n=1 Tax=Aquibium microcysteis TaxID=675281 RepID=UPI00165D194E|nr:hypothetical protein [Aquibium microcysteis]